MWVSIFLILGASALDSQHKNINTLFLTRVWSRNRKHEANGWLETVVWVNFSGLAKSAYNLSKICAAYLQKFPSWTTWERKPRGTVNSGWTANDIKINVVVCFPKVTHIVCLFRHCVHWDWLPEKISLPHLRILWWKETSQVSLCTHQRSIKVSTSNIHLKEATVIKI